VLTGKSDVADIIQPTPYENINIIPSELDLAGAEIEIAREKNHLMVVRRVIDRVLEAGVFDYVLMDCPPSIGILMTSSLAAADSILVTMQCEYYAMEGLSVITHLVSQLRESGVNPDLAIEGIVMTMFDVRTRLAADVVSEVREHFGELVYDTIIPRSVRISEAPSFGEPVIFFAPNSSGAIAYKVLAEEFVERHGGQ
jgi:chromosome partitioning protein